MHWNQQRKLAQHVVARFVTKSIVDGFEAIQINERQTKRRMALCGIGARLGDQVVKVVAIGQPRQRIDLAICIYPRIDCFWCKHYRLCGINCYVNPGAPSPSYGARSH